MRGTTVHSVIIVLGGGRKNDGSLTELSIQRLERGCELYKKGVSQKVFALGGHYSTYSPNSIYFPETGAELRKEYFCRHGVPEEDVILVPDGRDTMLEAFASRRVLRELGVGNIILVTSDKHMERAKYIFQRILGDGIYIRESKVPCGNILNKEEEREYLALVREFLERFPREIPDPNMESWIIDHPEYYLRQAEIHEKYHPEGKESQAYMGVEFHGKNL